MEKSLETHGNQSMNLDLMLATNIQSSQYFRDLYSLKTLEEVIDEIYNHVQYLCPYIPNTMTPSTAYCLLFKIFTLKPTETQMNTMVTHPDSPYIRALGFLYLRYCHTPANLWYWFSEFLDDQEEINTLPKSKPITMEIYLLGLLKDPKFADSFLPRIPLKTMKELEVKVADYEKKKGLNKQQNSRGGGGNNNYNNNRNDNDNNNNNNRGTSRGYYNNRGGNNNYNNGYNNNYNNNNNRGGRGGNDRGRDRDRDDDNNNRYNNNRNERGRNDRGGYNDDRRSRSRSRSRDRYKKRSRSRSRSGSRERYSSNSDRGGRYNRNNDRNNDRSRSRSNSRDRRSSRGGSGTYQQGDRKRNRYSNDRSRSRSRENDDRSSTSTTTTSTSSATPTQPLPDESEKLKQLRSIYGAPTNQSSLDRSSSSLLFNPDEDNITIGKK